MNNHFKQKYPLDRAQQLDILVKDQKITQRAVDVLDCFADLYGCIAYDLGMFPTNGEDAIMLTWNVSIEDIREGGRKRNTTIASLTLSPDRLTFQDGVSGSPTLELSWGSPELDRVIEKYRTCRT